LDFENHLDLAQST